MNADPRCTLSRRPKGRRVVWWLTGAVMTGIISYVLKSGLPAHPESSQYQAGQFSNGVALLPRSIREGARLWWDFLFAKPDGTVPDRAIPVQARTRSIR